MIKKIIIYPLILFTVMFFSIQNGLASGGDHAYQRHTQRTTTTAIDSRQYAVGKSIYTGTAQLSDVNPNLVESQKIRLARLEHPHGPDLMAYAGRLTESEMSALEYYVTKRHP